MADATTDTEDVVQVCRLHGNEYPCYRCHPTTHAIQQMLELLLRQRGIPCGKVVMK